MTSPILPNYLLSNRKRLALSQEDVAFLLGTRSGAKVSRHERFAREPSFKAALAYEVIYQRSASELFSGLYREVEREVTARAKSLSSKGGKGARQTAQRREALAAADSDDIGQLFRFVPDTVPTDIGQMSERSDARGQW